jgi:ABC-type branched-subunit amino acid transport system substrate-binding protein
MSRPGRLTAVLTAAVLLAAGACSTKTDTASPAPSGGGALKTDVGVTADTITLGVLTDRTGPFKAAGLGIEQGRTLFWNAKGKVCDRKVEFVTKDHKYSTTGASAAYAEVKDKVLALDELLGTPIIAGELKDIEADGMPTMAASFGSDLLAHKDIMIIGTTYDVEMINGVGYLVKNKGLAKGDKIGHIYHEGAYGENALAGSKAAADKYGLTLVEQKIKPADTDLTSAITALKSAGVKAILLTTSSAQSSNALQVAQAAGLTVPFVGSNPSFGAPLLAPAVAALAAKNYVVVGSIAPFSSTQPGPTTVREGFNTQYPKEPKSAFVMFGYAQQVILAQTIEAACKKGDLTRAGLVAAYHSLGDKVDTQGLLPTLDLSKSGGIPSRQTRILKPDATSEGGLAQVQDLAADDFALEYQK